MSKKKKVSTIINTSNTTSKNSIDFFNTSFFHYLLLFIGAWLLYGWTYKFGYNLDDDYVLYQLRSIDNSADGFFMIFKTWYANADYRPITILSFWLERNLLGEISSSDAHFFNVLFFSFLLIAIYRLIIVSKFSLDTDKLKLLALFTALFFLVHPNHVSVVANVKSRDNILSMLFGVLAAIQFIKAIDFKQYWRIFILIVLIILAMLSKQDAYSFIFFPILVLIFFRDIDRKKVITIAIALFVTLIITVNILNLITIQLDENLRKFVYGLPENPLYNNDTLLNRVSLSLTTLFYYLKFLIVPVGYHFYFGYDQIPLTSLFSLINVVCFTVVIIAFVLSIYCFKKNKIYLFCFLFYGISIAYALNLVIPVAGILMDRYNFIPSLAFCLCLSAVVIVLDKANIKNKWVLGLVVLYSIFTVYRTSAWKDVFTLFDRDIPHLTKSVNANRIAGGTYIHLAIEEEMKPNYNKIMTDSFINKGERYAIAASKLYDKSSQVWELLGLCDLYRKNNQLALEKFKRCYAVDTTYLSGINYLGFTYWNLGNIDSAYYYFNFVINKEPYFNYSANNMINMLIKNNRRQEADSLLNVWKTRFPNDVKLQNKIQEVNASQLYYNN